ncbi:MAG: N-acetylmuramoyl-L-alanine amidase [Candidatus Cloacimonadota bacterium]|nr:N-acetylmuramoyl-L-alanine amidase [Candidatus Cloacimonadota bacterium]
MKNIKSARFHYGITMKYMLILFSVCFSSFLLQADIVVEYDSQITPEIIKTTQYENQEYFNIFELNKAFHSRIGTDLLDSRLNLNIYNQQIIFLMESSYLKHQSEIYNLGKPVVLCDRKLLVPTSFLTHILPLIFPDKIIISNDKLIAAAPEDNSIKRIVIDPGHGGKDPGAIGYSKTFEKDIVLQIAKKLEKIIKKNLDVEVLLTRDHDEFISLQKRTQYANDNQADLFISIHCNAHRNSKVSGVEVFYLSTAKTDEARAVEALENAVVYKYEGGQKAVEHYDDLSFILADMAQSEHLEESYNLAMKLQANLIKTSNCRNRGVKQANFYVLRGAFMPSVLLELGFMTNKQEEEKLKKSSYQEQLAWAIYEGIKDFKYKYDQMQ